MTRAPALLLALALSTLVAAPAGAAAGSRLRPFHSCADLTRYTRAHARAAVPPATVAPSPATGPVTKGTEDGSSDGSASPETPPSSGTNAQEPGIDEPDLVKTDGGTLFTVAGGKLDAIDAGAAAPTLLSSVPIEGGGDAQLLEHDGRLLVISRAYAPVPEAPPNVDSANAAAAIAPGAGETVLTEVDARDPSAMRVVRTLRLDGAFVDARQKEAVARVVVSAATTVGPRGAVALPESRLAWGSRRGGHTHGLVRCRAVRHPASYDGSALLTVLTIDLDRGLPPIDSDAVMTNAQVVYGSPTSLYVATGAPDGETDVHRFDTSDPTRTDYRASGQLPGELLDQFSLSERDGLLRAATTRTDRSESRVTVLTEQAGRLVEVGAVGRLGGGERIYAVRFIGSTAYVVTFRQVDPLFVVDLSDATVPRVAGQLDLQGYSAYLHPVGDGLLLGIGQDATGQGLLLGTQLSLFDVSDPAHPTRLAQVALGTGSSSEVEYDHHAFLWWGPTSLAVVPVREQSFTGALGFKVTRDGIARTGQVSHDVGGGQVDIMRSAVVGDRLVTVSSTGVEASALDGLAPQGFLAFPDAGGGGGGAGPVVPMGR
jgi:hypothetical protein